MPIKPPESAGRAPADPEVQPYEHQNGSSPPMTLQMLVEFVVPVIAT